MDKDFEADVDVCQGCGAYYSLTKSLIEKWRATFKPKPGEVMPQLCRTCLFLSS